MKLKIGITGPRVHDVGYRVFLGKLAMGLAMPGFIAYNWNEEGHQKVIALAEGDPARIAILQKQIEEKKPELAEISSIIFEDYDGDVGRTSEFAMFLSFEQLDKAVPILQAVEANTALIPEIAKNTALIPEIAKNTALIPEIAKNTALIPEIAKNTALIPEIAKNTALIPEIAKNTALIPEIAKNTALIPQMAKNIEMIAQTTERTAKTSEHILEEVKGIREDQPSFAVQLKQLQQDVQAIKAQLGMQ